jgi:hypothetical protein
MADDAEQEQDGDIGKQEQCDATHGCLSGSHERECGYWPPIKIRGYGARFQGLFVLRRVGKVSRSPIGLLKMVR